MHALLLVVLMAPPPARLPLTTLVLYENGVGYFERRGLVPAGRVAEIPLEPGQLDDALKSLVVRSTQGVASVEFAPPLSAEAARAQAGLPEREAQASLENLLRALQGAEVEVARQGGVPVRGRVLEVAEEALGQVDKEGRPVPQKTLLVFGEGGLAQVPLARVEAVRPTGSQVALAWSRAVGATSLQAERERLVVRGAAGHGAVAVGYTTEAPVWRTTYRLVLGQRARLQGFALVHNDSDEPWEGVRVTLASGRPTSFLFPLAGPRYGRRDLLTPEDGLDPAPQLATREAREHLRGEGEWPGLSLDGVGTHGAGRGGGGMGSGSGSGAGRVVTVAGGLSDTVLEDGPTPLEPAAVSEAGDLFLYSVREPVRLGARKSALLPILDGATKAERVTVLDAQGDAFTGVRLENTTALTLEQGTLAIFTDGAYAGETQVDRVKPGEVRVLKHGADLDLLVGRTTQRAEGAPRRAQLTTVNGKGHLEVTRVDTLTHEVAFTSRVPVPRTVLVELTEARYRVVAGGDEDVRSPGQPRYGRLTVAPRAEATVALVEEGAVVERFALETLTAGKAAQLLARATAPEVRAVLAPVVGALEKAEAAATRSRELDGQARELEATLARLRENLAAVGKAGAADAARELGARLLAREDELAGLKRERDAAARGAAALRQALTAPRPAAR